MEQLMVRPWLGVLHGRVKASFVAGREMLGISEWAPERLAEWQQAAGPHALPHFADPGCECLPVANIADLLGRILNSRRGDSDAR